MNHNKKLFNFIGIVALCVCSVPLCSGETKIPLRPKASGREKVNVRIYGASGSKYKTTARIEAGSKQIKVADVGDFATGQGVTITGGNIHFEKVRIYKPSQRYNSYPATDEFELRGFDATKTFWRTFAIDVTREKPVTFRWTSNMGKTWVKDVPVTGDWQKLSDGVEIRFKTRYWRLGCMIAFDARADLLTEIIAVDGQIITLKDAVKNSSNKAVIRHHDRVAIDRALKVAMSERRALYFPAGHYKIDQGFVIPSKSIWIAGDSGHNTILDISEGTGPVFTFRYNKEVTLLNMSIMGHTGWNEYPLKFRRSNGNVCWAMNLRPCKAVFIRGSKHVWIENVHVSRMANEAFYCASGGRNKPEDKGGTMSLTYLRCSVTDVLFNAFNNNDYSDNISILYCRVNMASNFWEGAPRFLRCIGNHVRNCNHYGTFGGLKHRYEQFNSFGIGQMVIADNVFEGIKNIVSHGWRPGTGPIVVGPANQVIIRNNIFVNFSANNALTIGGYSRGYKGGHVNITGNMIDMTYEKGRALGSWSRSGIKVAISDVVISDNQIYVRGNIDPKVVGIEVLSSAANVTIHNNIISNCGYGIRTASARSSVIKVLGPGRFLKGKWMPNEWKYSHLYRDWKLHWLTGNNKGKISKIGIFNPKTLELKLKHPLVVKPKDSFVYFPEQANWLFHHNTITDCANPVQLEGYGSDTSFFTDNLISRGIKPEGKTALTMRGNYTVSGNTFSNFDKKDNVAIRIFPDPSGKLWNVNCRDNIFRKCAEEKIIEK